MFLLSHISCKYHVHIYLKILNQLIRYAHQFLPKPYHHNLWNIFVSFFDYHVFCMVRKVIFYMKRINCIHAIHVFCLVDLCYSRRLRHVLILNMTIYFAERNKEAKGQRQDRCMWAIKAGLHHMLKEKASPAGMIYSSVDQNVIINLEWFWQLDLYTSQFN